MTAAADNLKHAFDLGSNAVLTPDMQSAWAQLSTASHTRMAVIFTCCVLVGAILMTSGARFLLMATVLFWGTPNVAELGHHMAGVDEAHLRSILYAIAFGLGSV